MKNMDWVGDLMRFSEMKAKLLTSINLFRREKIKAVLKNLIYHKLCLVRINRAKVLKKKA